MTKSEVSPCIRPETLLAAERATEKLRVAMVSMMEPGSYGEVILKVSFRDGNISHFDVDRKESHKIG